MRLITKVGKKLAAITLAAVMALTFMPVTGTQTAYAEDEGLAAIFLADTLTLGSDLNTANAQTVYFGGTAWRVIGYNGNGIVSGSGTATLLSAGNLGNTLFDDSGNNSEVYADSTLKKKVDAIADSLSSAEKNVIVPRTLVSTPAMGTYSEAAWDYVAGDADIQDALMWPLSINEANAVDKNLRHLGDNVTANYWWLRSPGETTQKAGSVASDKLMGEIRATVLKDKYVYSADNAYGVCPAFNLDLDSVVMTTTTNAKPSVSVGMNSLKSIPANATGPWKLTLHDEERDGFTASAADGAVLKQEPGYSDWSIPVVFSGAKTGDNEYVTAILCDRSGDPFYYGNIAKDSAETTQFGQAVEIPEGLAKGNYTLFVFSEQINGSDKTDYVSSFSEIELSVNSSLDDPTDLAWADSEDGTKYATWKGVDGAELYLVQLEKDGSYCGAMSIEPQTMPDAAGTAYGDFTVAHFFSSCISNEGPGTYTFTVQAVKGSYPYEAESSVVLSEDYKRTEDISGAEVTGIVNKTYTGKAQTQSPVVSVMLGERQVSLENGTDYNVAYKNNVNAGTATVTITGKDGYTGQVEKTFTIASKKITPAVTLAKSAYTWNGQARKPAAAVKDGSTKLAASDYTVTYKNNKNVGKASAVVTPKGNYSGAKTVSFNIDPKGTSLSKLTRAKKAVTVKWKKQAAKMSSSRITGYQIQLATNSKFTKNKKSVTVKGYSKVSKKVTGLKGGKKYYVRIRTCKTVSGKKYYSPWSKVKTVKTKK